MSQPTEGSETDAIHTSETLRQIAATLDHLRCMPTWQRVLIRAASALEASEAREAALTAENATLREALTRIADGKRYLSSHQAMLTARAALRQEGKP